MDSSTDKLIVCLLADGYLWKMLSSGMYRRVGLVRAECFGGINRLHLEVMKILLARNFSSNWQTSGLLVTIADSLHYDEGGGYAHPKRRL
jgi:hypothetical protein